MAGQCSTTREQSPILRRGRSRPCLGRSSLRGRCRLPLIMMCRSGAPHRTGATWRGGVSAQRAPRSLVWTSREHGSKALSSLERATAQSISVTGQSRSPDAGNAWTLRGWRWRFDRPCANLALIVCGSTHEGEAWDLRTGGHTTAHRRPETLSKRRTCMVTCTFMAGRVRRARGWCPVSFRQRCGTSSTAPSNKTL